MSSKNSILARGQVFSGGHHQVPGTPPYITSCITGCPDDPGHHPGVPDAPEHLFVQEDDGSHQEPKRLAFFLIKRKKCCF
jgi:hypothetical protein